MIIDNVCLLLAPKTYYCKGSAAIGKGRIRSVDFWQCPSIEATVLSGLIMGQTKKKIYVQNNSNSLGIDGNVDIRNC